MEEQLCGRSFRRWQYVLGEYQTCDHCRDRPGRLLWRSAVKHSAGCLSADREHARAGECSIRTRSRYGLALPDWARKAGHRKDPATGKAECVAASGVCAEQEFFDRTRQSFAGKGAHSADAGRRGYTGYAGSVCIEPVLVDVDLRVGAVDCMRKHCQPASGSRHGAKGGDVRTDGAGCKTRENCPAVAHRERGVGGVERRGRAFCRVWGNADAAEAGFSRSAKCSDTGQSVSVGDRLCVRSGTVDRRFVWGGAGTGLGRRRSRQMRCAAARGRRRRGLPFCSADWWCCRPGCHWCY